MVSMTSGRSDPDQPGVLHGAGEIGVLGQESIAGVDRLGAGLLGRLQDPFGVPIRLGGAAAPSRTATSASRTNGRSASTSECTATVRIPISRAVRMIRRAISPRLATSKVLNIERLSL